jgi:hypothetical protein
VIVVPASPPAKSLKDLIAMEKRSRASSPRVGRKWQFRHLAGELLKSTAKIDVLRPLWEARRHHRPSGRAHFAMPINWWK